MRIELQVHELEYTFSAIWRIWSLFLNGKYSLVLVLFRLLALPHPDKCVGTSIAGVKTLGPFNSSVLTSSLYVDYGYGQPLVIQKWSKWAQSLSIKELKYPDLEKVLLNNK